MLSKFATERRAKPSSLPKRTFWGIPRMTVVISTTIARSRYQLAESRDNRRTPPPALG